MIKQVRLYRFTKASPSFNDWLTIFDHYPARECENGQEKTLGWRILPATDGVRGIQLQGSRYLYAEGHYFRRSVPKSTLERETNKRIAALVEQGETVTKAERSAIKLEIRTELLQKMPQTDTIIPFIIDTECNEIWIGATSEGVAGDLRNMLSASKMELLTTALFEGIDIGDWLTGWANQSRSLPETFELGGKVRMTARESSDVSISTSKEYLESDEIRTLVNTRTVQALELVSEPITVTFNHDGSLKSIRFDNKDQMYDDFAHEISYCIIELRALIDSLCKTIGAPLGH